tara:strand:+ start:570 stop:734 length:165 start_codon:yes stop_codon:yes gene_type:complete
MHANENSEICGKDDQLSSLTAMNPHAAQKYGAKHLADAARLPYMPKEYLVDPEI